jgi:hypothetical protein
MNVKEQGRYLYRNCTTIARYQQQRPCDVHVYKRIRPHRQHVFTTFTKKPHTKPNSSRKQTPPIVYRNWQRWCELQQTEKARPKEQSVGNKMQPHLQGKPYHDNGTVRGEEWTKWKVTKTPTSQVLYNFSTLLNPAQPSSTLPNPAQPCPTLPKLGRSTNKVELFK